MIERGAVRNLEQLQEEDPGGRAPRGVTLAFVVLGGACIVFAAMALSGRKSAPDAKRTDPLGELVASAHGAGKSERAQPMKPTELAANEVTFPGILSDSERPTTALAAVKNAPPAAAAPALAAAPPPATDRLPVVPLPAQHVLQATPVVTRPRDALTRAANESAQITTAPAPATGAGREGGWQLQVSSFRSQTEAQSFADQLRARSHKAYVSEAHVSGRGTWYRVRVGPFPSQQAAASYRSTFESKEHVVPFIVQPSK